MLLIIGKKKKKVFGIETMYMCIHSTTKQLSTYYVQDSARFRTLWENKMLFLFSNVITIELSKWAYIFGN